MCLLVEVYVNHCFRNSAKNSSNVAKGLFFLFKKKFFLKAARSCIVALHSWFNIKAKTCFDTGSQPVIWGRRQGRLGYGVNPVEMQQFVALSCWLFVVRRVHLAGNRRIAHVERRQLYIFFLLKLSPSSLMRCLSLESVSLHTFPSRGGDIDNIFIYMNIFKK